jgi:predicted nucleic acid-binding protein
LPAHVGLLSPDLYKQLERQALLRIAQRDADDWHIIACAMLLGCPIWTEDRDFFGCGIATWTTDRIAVYFDGAP